MSPECAKLLERVSLGEELTAKERAFIQTNCGLEPGKTRDRTVYRLTHRGRRALADYARTPVRVTPIKSDPLLRLLICDLVGEPVTRAALLTLREDIADIRARLDESEERAQALPHREKYLRLTIDHLRGLAL